MVPYTKNMDPIQSQPHISKKYIIVTALFIVVFGLGLGLGSQIPRFLGKTYNDGWNAARERIASSPRFGFIADGPDEVGELYGVIESLNENTLTLSIEPLEPFADPSLDTRTVMIEGATKITKVTVRSLSEIQAETKDTTVLPDPIVIQDASRDELKVGTRVFVQAGVNIKDAHTFTAKEIQVQ